MIKENLLEVHDNIIQACHRCGRDPNDVHLISVTKTKPVEDLVQAYDCGERLFGENKVQEMCTKYDALNKDIEWHMIGHLQRNKVKYLIGKVSLIHSVDSVRLAKQIQDESKKLNVVTNILLEINVSNEDTKFGLKVNEALSAVKEISTYPNIRIMGLMTIAPYTSNPESNRTHFRNLKKLSVDISSKNIDNVNMSVLSMGMTGDYEVAIEEGATYIRVGTGIFGTRNYNINE